MSAAEQFFKSIYDEQGNPVVGVRYTEHRLAACFDEGAEGFHVLKLLARQQISEYDAAKLIQKILKGHRVNLPLVEYVKYTNDRDASQLE